MAVQHFKLVGFLIGLLAVFSWCGMQRAVKGVTPVPGGRDNGSLTATRNADGSLGLTTADGAPANGVKLSQYDRSIASPCVAVGPDDTIHVAFVEKFPNAPYPNFVYYRQSIDGGKTWSESKNLSEDMPNINVGNCKLLVDGRNRVYVIWRTGLAPNFPSAQAEAYECENNLVFRCLSDGKWSKILPLYKPATAQTQDLGSISFMAVVDAAGHAQVIYNVLPTHFHPDQAMQWGMKRPGVKAGLTEGRFSLRCEA